MRDHDAGTVYAALRAVDPARTNVSTARELTQLLAQMWSDAAGPEAACAQARDVMAMQVWPHRLASGVEDGASYAGKTGTLPGMRHEAGVVTTADGQSVAIAVLTQADDLRESRPDIDRAIGEAGRLAVRFLAP